MSITGDMSTAVVPVRVLHLAYFGDTEPVTGTWVLKVSPSHRGPAFYQLVQNSARTVDFQRAPSLSLADGDNTLNFGPSNSNSTAVVVVPSREVAYLLEDNSLARNGADLVRNLRAQLPVTSPNRSPRSQCAPTVRRQTTSVEVPVKVASLTDPGRGAAPLGGDWVLRIYLHSGGRAIYDLVNVTTHRDTATFYDRPTELGNALIFGPSAANQTAVLGIVDPRVTAVILQSDPRDGAALVAAVAAIVDSAPPPQAPPPPGTPEDVLTENQRATLQLLQVYGDRRSPEEQAQRDYLLQLRAAGGVPAYIQGPPPSYGQATRPPPAYGRSVGTSRLPTLSQASRAPSLKAGLPNNMGPAAARFNSLCFEEALHLENEYTVSQLKTWAQTLGISPLPKNKAGLCLQVGQAILSQKLATYQQIAGGFPRKRGGQ